MDITLALGGEDPEETLISGSSVVWNRKAFE